MVIKALFWGYFLPLEKNQHPSSGKASYLASPSAGRTENSSLPQSPTLWDEAVTVRQTEFFIQI